MLIDLSLMDTAEQHVNGVFFMIEKLSEEQSHKHILKHTSMNKNQAFSRRKHPQLNVSSAPSLKI